MANTTVTFRTEEELKRDATRLFESLGMNLSIAINMFLKQSVLKQQYPCSLELSVAGAVKAAYSPDFFSLFGAASDLNLIIEPDDPAPEPLLSEIFC